MAEAKSLASSPDHFKVSLEGTQRQSTFISKEKTGKSGKKVLKDDSEYDDIVSEQLDTFTDNSPSKIGGMSLN